MKKYILPLICICLIAFLLFSCADCPSCEMKPFHPNNYLVTGFYHSMILPFSVVGKILGFHIGIYSIEKSHFTYWVGFLLGLFLYAKLFVIIGRISKE